MELIPRICSHESLPKIIEDWKESDRRTKTVSLLELTLQLTGHKISFNDDPIPDDFGPLVADLDDSAVYAGHYYYTSLPKVIKDRVTKFYTGLAEDATPDDDWLHVLLLLTHALIERDGRENEEFHTTAVQIHLLFLTKFSQRRLKNPNLRELCEHLFGNIHLGFMYKAISNQSVHQFCTIMETYPHFYIVETNMMDNYFKILTYESLQETKMAIKSLKKLLGLEAAVREAVAEYIFENFLPILRNLSFSTKPTLLVEVFQLMIALQEYFGSRKIIFSEKECKPLYQRITHKTPRIQHLATKFAFLTSKVPFEEFMQIICANEISMKDIFKLVESNWSPDIFCNWDEYLTLMQKEKKFMFSIAPQVASAALKHLKKSYKPADIVVDNVQFEYAVEFLHEFPKWLHYFHTHDQGNVLSYIISMISDIDIELYEYIRDGRVLTTTLAKSFEIIMTTAQYKNMCQLLWFCQSLHKQLNDAGKRDFNEKMNKLIDDNVQHVKEAIGSGAQIHEKCLKFLAAVAIIVDASKVILLENECGILLQPDVLQNIESKATVFILAHYLYATKLKSAVDAQDTENMRKEIQSLVKLMDICMNYMQQQDTLSFENEMVFQTHHNILKIVYKTIPSAQCYLKMARIVILFTYTYGDTKLLQKWVENSGKIDIDEPAELLMHFGKKNSEIVDAEFTKLLLKMYEKNFEHFFGILAFTIITIVAGNNQTCALDGFLSKFLKFVDNVIPEPDGVTKTTKGVEFILARIIQLLVPNNGFSNDIKIQLTPIFQKVYKNRLATINLQNSMKELLETVHEEEHKMIINDVLNDLQPYLRDSKGRSR